MATSPTTSKAPDKLGQRKSIEDEVEVLENGGLSPQLSLRTDDDTCSEIIRIEQQSADEPAQVSALERIARTLQVSVALELPLLPIGRKTHTRFTVFSMAAFN